jgi:hypothetical protein
MNEILTNEENIAWGLDRMYRRNEGHNLMSIIAHNMSVYKAVLTDLKYT